MRLGQLCEMEATFYQFMLSCVYRQNLYVETQPACINILSTLTGSKTHTRIN
jgi:hypothetical protein